MILRPAPRAYSAEDQGALRDAVRRADGDNLKRGRDLDLGPARLILTSPDGSRFALTVDNAGNLAAAAV